MAFALDLWLIRWRVPEQRQRVLPRVARHLAYLVEDQAFLGLAHMPIPRRQRAYQVMPTGSLHLSDLTFGGFLAETTTSANFRGSCAAFAFNPGLAVPRFRVADA